MKQVKTRNCLKCGKETLEADGLRELVSNPDRIACRLPETGGRA